MTALTTILPLVAEGWRIFPVRKAGKSPAISNWPAAATNDEAQLTAWETQFPECNWGLACGSESGVFVIDIDGAAGLGWLQDQTREYGDAFANTRAVQTARGVHLYFRWESGTAIRNSAGKIAEGVDVRGAGGYVLLPGSVHPDGTAYKWIGDAALPILSAPAALLEQASAASRGVENVLNIPSNSDSTGRIPAGERNSTLTAIAGAMRRRNASQPAITAALMAQNAASCEPPLEDAEVRRIAGSISQYAPAPPGTDWQKRLLRGKEGGSPMRLLANATIALRASPEFTGVLAFDEFAGATATLHPTPWRDGIGVWGEDDDRHLAEWLQLHNIGVPSRIAAEAAETVARENGFHPVKNYLESLTWDSVERLDYWMSVCLGAEESEYVRAIGSRILIAACARIYAPGCQCDSLPVLQGPQGILKSSVVRELFSTPWFSDHISDLHNKDARLELRGRWCVELSELNNLRRSEIETVKAFLSCRVDSYRPPYGVRRIDVPRSSVFFGSTNDDHPFTDSTGSRRFWPLQCGKIDLDAVRRNRDQLWAEALFRYRRGDVHYLDTPELMTLAKEAAEEAYEKGARDDVVEAWIENPKQRAAVREWDDAPPWFGSQVGKINVTDVLIHGLGMKEGLMGAGDTREVSRCLKHLGYKSVQERSGENRGRRYWRREPEEKA